MSFARMKSATLHLLHEVCEHPFNKELMHGTLSKEVFRVYLEQDALYLKDFCSALQLTSKRLVDTKHTEQFRVFSEETLALEREIHARYLGEFNTLGLFSQKQNIEKNPVISNYTSHLLEAANKLSVEAAVASLVPCFWLYNELGHVIAGAEVKTINNPYQPWIATYSDEKFTESTQSMIKILEELSAGISCPVKKEEMDSAFIKSTEYEILFLDSVTHHCPSWREALFATKQTSL